MGFAAGSISFTRLAIVGEHPKEIDQEILDKLSELTLETGEYGVSEEVEYGWCGGRHGRRPDPDESGQRDQA